MHYIKAKEIDGKIFQSGSYQHTTDGVRGEVKVYPTTDDVRRFDDLKECSLRYRKRIYRLTCDKR